jgi:hypothetical protein
VPNQYSSLPPGKIWVPTPSGNVAMTLAEARAYQAQHRYAVTDPTNPNLTPEVRAELQDPRMQAAIAGQQTTKVRVNDTVYTLDHGQVVGMEQGGHGALSPLVWAAKHPKITIALMAAPVAAPYAIHALTAGGAAGAGTGAGTAGTAGVLPATATVPTSTGTIAGLSGGTGFGTAAGVGTGAGAAGATTASAVLPSTTLPTSTGTVAGLAPTGAVQAATTPSVTSWLSGTGQFLGSPGGATLAGVAGNLIGAGIQSSANTKAAEIAAQTAREALAYEKQRDAYAQQLEASRYGDLTGRLAPYISTGQNASARMAAILGLPAPDPATTGPVAPTPMGSTPNAAPTYQTHPGLDTSQPPVGTAIPRPGGVLMRAPDGTLKQVPPDQVPHYQSRGAQLVNG